MIYKNNLKPLFNLGITVHLFTIDLLGKPLKFEGSMAGWQQLIWGDVCVSQITATDSNSSNVHAFELKVQKQNTVTDDSIDNEDSFDTILVSLAVDLSWQPFELKYKLSVNDDVVSQDVITSKTIEEREVVDVPKQPMKFSSIGLIGFGLKMLKSAKVIKVLLAAGSLAAYSWLFSIEFAIALIFCLVWHEYGHIKAMQYFGMKTKGIYLIPFVGGLAVSDEKLNTRWQNVVISIMGPFFGLILAVACLIGYWITDVEILAGLATFSAFLNIFNLLPILPLDGGHVLKSIAFSVNSKVGLAVCILGAALGVYISYYFGLALLGFFLAIGSIEIVFEYKQRHHSNLLPLDRYGQIVSALWYVITVGGLAAVIWILGQTDNDALSLPFKILGS